jgi:hypothetical protein
MSKTEGWNVFLLIVFLCGSGLCTDKPTRLTTKEAQMLVRASLSGETRRLPGLELVPTPDSKSDECCVTFDVLWRNPDPGSAHVQFVAVDLNSGDVWNPMLCERVRGREIQSLQVKLRRQHRIPDTTIKHARSTTQCCK